MLPDPRIAQGAFGCTDRNNLPANAEHRASIYDAYFLEVESTARAGILRGATDRKKLADVSQQKRII